jgi:uncharacterized membrane protein
MRTITWRPSSNKELDVLFENCRLEQYNDKSHRLWQNYGPDSFKYAVALTICFDDTGNVEMCSSIASRDCWPMGAYRILNRLWKHSNKIAFPRKMSPSFALSAKSQKEWLEENTDYKLLFISRQTDSWQQFGIDNFQHYYNMTFETDNYKYLTCPNQCDNTCWQHIIYQGNGDLLSQWKRRL